jgi:hypothetical protein
MLIDEGEAEAKNSRNGNLGDHHINLRREESELTNCQPHSLRVPKLKTRSSTKNTLDSTGWWCWWSGSGWASPAAPRELTRSSSCLCQECMTPLATRTGCRWARTGCRWARWVGFGFIEAAIFCANSFWPLPLNFTSTATVLSGTRFFFAFVFRS